jgi:hypothetical protein
VAKLDRIDSRGPLPRKDDAFPAELVARWRDDAGRTARYGPSIAIDVLRFVADELERSLDSKDRIPEAVSDPTRDSRALCWRERLWVVPPETRLGVAEVVEATGRSRDWVYRHTSAAGAARRLPHRKLEGELVFTAGELRDWIRGAEITISSPVLAPRMPRGRLPRGSARATATGRTPATVARPALHPPREVQLCLAGESQDPSIVEVRTPIASD